MGSSEFLQALLSTIDSSYKNKFSFKTRILLKFTNTLFPRYINLAAKSRLELKKCIEKSVKIYKPDLLIELGSGHSREYISLMEKGKIKKIIQVDREKVISYENKNYQFIEGDITKKDTWTKISKSRAKKGLIIAEGLFSYLNNDEFDFVIGKMKILLENNFSLITHEPITPISISRKIISLFIGKTYRRFDSLKQIKEYYSSKGLNVRVIDAKKWQIVYQVYNNNS